MVIHPPILFLGFASTIVPFAFAYAGLTNKEHSWTKAALPWSLLSVAVLGTGIMMGAAWAYESLTFGGYWAWDPVENASLVPWLVMVAGLHTNLIYRHSGYSLKSTYIFYVLSFILILYSTFLTRSGILGDTSVHAFTGEGMNQQLLAFLSLFVWLPSFVESGKKGKITVAITIALIILLTFILPETLTPGLWLVSLVGFLVAYGIQVNRDKSIPAIQREEDIYSREFWMFIGSLVFFLGAVIIISQTSLPVINKAFNKKMAEASDAQFSYNKIQIFIAIIVGTLTAITQYLKYKQTPKALFYKKLLFLPSLPYLLVLLSQYSAILITIKKVLVF
jgi:cytochrome c-type biogenesis protein CcmF